MISAYMITSAAAFPFLGQVIDVVSNSKDTVIDAAHNLKSIEGETKIAATDIITNRGALAIEDKIDGGRKMFSEFVNAARQKLNGASEISDLSADALEEKTTTVVYALQELAAQFGELKIDNEKNWLGMLEDKKYDSFGEVTEFLEYIVDAKEAIMDSAFGKYEHAVLATEALALGVIEKAQYLAGPLVSHLEMIEMVVKGGAAANIYDIKVLGVDQAFEKVAELIEDAECKAYDFIEDKFAQLANVCEGCPFEPECEQIVDALHAKSLDAFYNKESAVAVTYSAAVNVWEAAITKPTPCPEEQ